MHATGSERGCLVRVPNQRKEKIPGSPRNWWTPGQDEPGWVPVAPSKRARQACGGCRKSGSNASAVGGKLADGRDRPSARLGREVSEQIAGPEEFVVNGLASDPAWQTASLNASKSDNDSPRAAANRCSFRSVEQAVDPVMVNRPSSPASCQPVGGPRDCAVLAEVSNGRHCSQSSSYVFLRRIMPKLEDACGRTTRRPA